MTPSFLILQILCIHILAAVFPGPNIFVTVKNAVFVSRQAGIFTGIGIVIANAMWIFLSIFSFSNLDNPKFLQIFKYCGAIYLIFLGGKFFISAPQKILQKKSKKISTGNFWKFIKEGFLVCISNVKGALFFAGLFSFVFTHENGKNILPIVVPIILINSFLWWTFLATFFSQKKIREIFERNEKILFKIFGTVFILFGLKFLFF